MDNNVKTGAGILIAIAIVTIIVMVNRDTNNDNPHYFGDGISYIEVK